jgi:hypothetical protein
MHLARLQNYTLKPQEDVMRICQNKHFHQFYKLLIYHGYNVKMFLNLAVLHDPKDNFNYLLYNILIIQCTKRLLTKL